MTDFHQSKIVGLIGPCDGSNRDFETPTKYVAGTIRVTWNGQVVSKDDGKKGWAETSDSMIKTAIAPRTGDELQAFYQDKDITGQLEIEDVRGSPFDPNGVLP